MLPQYCESNKFDTLLLKKRKAVISQSPTLKELPNIPHLQATPEHSSLTELKEHRKVTNRKAILDAYNKWEKDNAPPNAETSPSLSPPAHCAIKEILLRNIKNTKSNSSIIPIHTIKSDESANEGIVSYS